MSTTDNPVSWKEAAKVAASFISLIQDLNVQPRVCGSVRRRKPTVNDIEIVCVPSNRLALLARLDKLVLDGICTKAVYQNYTHRWDIKYAGIEYQGVRIEVFGATPENLGYITWLRTGPGDANTHVMQQLGGWPVRFDDGYAWTATYERGMKTLVNKLRVPDEETLFRLIGMQYLPPEKRTVDAYRHWLKKKPPSADFINSLVIPNETPKQKGMF